MSVDQSKQIASRFYPLNTRWFRITMLIMMPIWAVWQFAHFPSFAIVNGAIAGIGPIVVGLLAGVRQKDWRFIRIGLGYALFVYWQGQGWLW